MANEDQVIDILARVRTDPGAEQAAKTLNQIKEALAGLYRTSRDNAPSDATLAKIVQQWQQATAGVKAYNDSLLSTKRHEEEISRIRANSLRNGQAQTGRVQGSGGRARGDDATSLFQSEGFRQAQISRAILYGGFSIPGDVGRGVTSVFGALSSLQEVDARFKQLAASGDGLRHVLAGTVAPAAAAAIGIGVVIAALHSLNETTKGASQALEATLAALQKFYTEINSLTKQEVETRAQTLREQLNGQRRYLEQLRGQYEAQRNSQDAPVINVGDQPVRLQFLRDLQTLFGSAAPAGLGTSLGLLEKQIDDTSKAVTDAETTLDAYTNALRTNATLLQDARVAIEAYFDELTKDAQEQVANAKLVRSGNVEAAKEQLKGIEDTIAANEELFQTAVNKFETLFPGPLVLELDAANRPIGAVIADLKDLKETMGNSLSPAAKALLDRLISLGDGIVDDSLKASDLLNNIIPLTEARKKELDAIKAAEKAAQENARNFEKLAQIQADIDKAVEEREKQLSRQAEEKRIQDERDLIEKDFQSRIAAAKEEERQASIFERIEKLKKEAGDKDIEAQAELDRDIARINNDFMADAAEAWAKFYNSELERIKDNNDRRLKLLEEAALTLAQLASKRQVAEFIAEQKRLELRLRQLDRDNDQETRRRQSAFLAQRQAEEDDRARRIAALRETFLIEQTIRRNELAAQIAEEMSSLVLRRTRSQQLEEQFAAIREQWQQQDYQRRLSYEAIDYQNRINLMRQKQAEILAEIFNYYSQQQSFFGNVVQTARAAISAAEDLMNRVRAAANTAPAYSYSPPVGTYSSPYQGPVYTPAPPPPAPSPAVSAAIQYTFPQTRTATSQQGAYNPYTQSSRGRFFASGSGMMDVPYDNYAAMLHEGERVLNKMENKEYSRRSGQTFVLNLTTSDVASKANIKEAADYLHDQWRQATRSVR